MKLFVDTSALVALADRTDQFHAAAKDFAQSLPPTTRFHTSHAILSETITRLRATAGVQIAVRAAEALLESACYQIHTLDDDTIRHALRIMRKYGDHRLSFADCTSIVLLEELGLDHIFAFDEDFRKVGYQVVPNLAR